MKTTDRILMEHDEYRLVGTQEGYRLVGCSGEARLWLSLWGLGGLYAAAADAIDAFALASGD